MHVLHIVETSGSDLALYTGNLVSLTYYLDVVYAMLTGYNIMIYKLRMPLMISSDTSLCSDLLFAVQDGSWK
ncbi:hypothetical protein L195_g022421 [Trifolium pratense]|uniref:Uncharacterized protein n=1 Tax=Trifolium pratense TaxID=57577 RepID=A0A2K3N6V2_TRIPR|nr:hypothetical protein L195_g022007 [Trifolium pratense]PNX99158.1 hypothetical protein L195_g022421 [Trifolium pratense]